MEQWLLWSPVEPGKLIVGITPELESWDAKGSPTQVKLAAFLKDVETKLGPLPGVDVPLFARLVVDIEQKQQGDLDNYLKPVVHHLGWQRFVYASGRRRRGGGSSLTVGEARRTPWYSANGGWQHLGFSAPNYTNWKQNLRSRFQASGVSLLPPGPVEVRISWKCSSNRNWVDYPWKETIDAMGPVLGAPDPKRPFHVDDERIESLDLYRVIDESMGWSLRADVWWRPVGNGD